MRFVLTAITLFFLVKISTFAESDTTTVLKDSVRTVAILPEQNDYFQWLQFTSSAGTGPLPYKSLNSFFTENGFGEIRGFKPALANGFLYNALEEQIAFKKWNIILGFAFQKFANGIFEESTKQLRTEASLKTFDVNLGAGYSVFKNDFFRINPFITVGLRTNYLTIEQGYAYGNFANVLHSSYRSNEFTNIGINGDIGIAWELTVYTSSPDTLRPELAQSEYFLSFKSAYSLGIFERGWTSGSMPLLNGPGIKANGIRLELGIGIRSIPRFYKAKIISEEK